MFTRLARRVTLVLVAAVLVAACTSGDDSAEESSDDTTAASTAAPATGPAPGVTDDAIKVGFTFVDAEALEAVGLELNLGDYQAAYQALVDQINEEGGINGRQIEPVFAPVDPTTADPGAEQCVQLTEDEDVFVVVGFFLTDGVLCTVGTHATAVVGGEHTPERIAQAEAPWISNLPDDQLPSAAIGALAERGDLDGTVAVYAAARDENLVNDQITPALEEAGIEVAEVAINDAPPEDTAALQANVGTIAQRFEAAGVDTVVLAGASGQDWPTAINALNSDFRPTIVFLDDTALTAFTSNVATTDTSVLAGGEGALAAGTYGPPQAIWEEEGMQECIATLEAAGMEIPAPDDVAADPNDQTFQPAFFGCPEVTLMRAWLEAAGEDLNYGTLATAIEGGLEIPLPGDPTPRTYGPAPAGDGDPAAFIFTWDDDAQTLVAAE